MKAKILITISIIVAVMIGMGIFITANAFGLHERSINVGVTILLVLLGAYIFALLLKKRRLTWIILSIWCLVWLISYIVCITFLKDSSGDIIGLVATLGCWPAFVSSYLLKDTNFERIILEHFEYTAAYIISFFEFAFVTFLLSLGAFGLRKNQR